MLTTESAADASAVPNLVADLVASVSKVIGDGAYDGQPVSEFLTNKFGPNVEIVIPPPCNAALGLNDQRNSHIHGISEGCRMARQNQSGYNQRSKVEAQISRWKQVIGNELHSRKRANQKSEARTAARAQKRMTSDGRAIFERAT